MNKKVTDTILKKWCSKLPKGFPTITEGKIVDGDLNVLKEVVNNILMAEAKGILGRDQGDEFLHVDGRIATFDHIERYPPGKDKFDTFSDMENFIERYEDAKDIEIEWVNNKNQGMRSFYVAILRDNNTGEELYWGRYFRQIPSNTINKWKNKEIPTGWALQTKGAKKLDLGVDPQNLIKTEKIFTEMNDVIELVGRNSPEALGPILVKSLEDVINGIMPEFPNQEENQPALRDYFGEILGPLAMMGGLVKGDAEVARETLAGGYEWSDLEIFWPQSKNNALVDSIFINKEGNHIGISSKGGKGAMASVKSLSNAVDKARKTNPKMLDDIKFTVEVLDIIDNTSVKEGPLVLGEYFGVTTSELRHEILGYINQGDKKQDFKGLSKEAISWAKLVSPKSLDIRGFNTGLAILAEIAKSLANDINENPEFSHGAITLLNQSDIIQLHTKTHAKNGTVYVTEFKPVYPPTFNGDIHINGGKNYFSTRAQAKFAFQFKPKSGVTKELK